MQIFILLPFTVQEDFQQQQQQNVCGGVGGVGVQALCVLFYFIFYLNFDCWMANSTICASKKKEQKKGLLDIS